MVDANAPDLGTVRPRVRARAAHALRRGAKGVRGLPADADQQRGAEQRGREEQRDAGEEPNAVNEQHEREKTDDGGGDHADHLTSRAGDCAADLLMVRASAHGVKTP
jgi:hypothetical protein